MRGDATRGRKRSDITAEAHVFRQRILDYLDAYGGSTIAALSAELGCLPSKMRRKMAILREDGDVHSELIPCGGSVHIIAIYYLGPGENESSSREISQRTVHKWKPQTIKHDPLHAAFHNIQQ